MKMTDRIGPNRSGMNHRGHRYTPKPLVRRGIDGPSGGYLPISQDTLREMVKDFRAKVGRDPTTYHHSGLGRSGEQMLLRIGDGDSIWIKTVCNGKEDYLE
jgi:hypothetical protein